MKKPLQSYSSVKSLKKSNSKANLKRQASSPYLQVIDNSHTKISRSKSPKRKNKSVDIMKIKNGGMSQVGVGVRSKLGVSFESMKKSVGDLFGRMNVSYKKDK